MFVYKSNFYVTLLFTLVMPCGIFAQQKEDLSAGLEVAAEAQISVSDGETPLWLNANKYGLSSLDKVNEYLRVSAMRPAKDDEARRWKWGYGADIAVAGGYTSILIIQQAFAEIAWGHGLLSVGSKEEPMQLKNNELSSGSQTLGKNARPVPQVRLSLPEYWTIPGLKRWLHFKGHLAYGRFTDDRWQRHFTADLRQEAIEAGHNDSWRSGSYCKNVLYHSKAAYLKIGESEHLPWLSLELGVEMASQFGGQKYYIDENGQEAVLKANTGLSAYIHALVAGGQDATDGEYGNEEGNHLGSWMARLNYNNDTWGASFYIDHFFEDYSGMVLLAYDGYGEGDEWNVRKEHRYYRFPLKDFMLGLEVNFHQFSWVKNIVVEYLHTKYQSGPYNHDSTAGISDSIDGVDDYYNHNIYNSWQHWGQVMGNPLYMSPIYNEDGMILVANNRFKAIHVGVNGTPVKNLDYRILATYEAGWGTYNYPYTHRKNDFSGLIETAYRLKDDWQFKCSIGFDHGELLGNNFGVQLTVRRTLWRGAMYK